MGRVEAIAFARMMPDSDIAKTLNLQRLLSGRYLRHNKKPRRGKRRLRMKP